MDYSGVLSLTFKNWWKFKRYWLVVFLALFNPFLLSFIGLFFAGSSGDPYYLTGTRADVTNGLIPRNYNIDTFLIGVSIVFIVSLIIYIFYVLIIGNMFLAGLVKAYYLSNETGKSLGIREVLKIGSKYWLKLIAQKLLVATPLIIIIVIFSTVITVLSIVAESNGQTSSKSSPSFILTFLLGISCFYIVIFLLSLVIQILNEIAARYLVLEDLGIWESIKSGIKFVRKNFKIVVMSILMLFLLGMIVYAIVLIPSFITSFLSFTSIGITGVLLETDPIIALVVFLVTTAIASLVYIFALALSMTLNISFWNSLYIKFKEYKASTNK